MGGFFGVTSRQDCILELFYGTDYHSHLGTKRGGLAVFNRGKFASSIHNIENTQFRSKFDDEIGKMHGNKGIGVISDTDNQPLLIRSHLGDFAIVTVGAIKNADKLAASFFKEKRLHFSEMMEGVINPTELAAVIITREESIESGIKRLHDSIEGSCSLLIMTSEGIYAARDKLGRTPVVVGKKESGYAVTLETCAFPNLGYEVERYLGPGEIVFLNEEGYEQRVPPGSRLQICGFLWIYFGYPSSNYEGINVEWVRNICGALLAKRFPIEVDFVAGIPDSGVGHGLGYAGEARLPFKRPFVKYTPTWPRSFMPHDQAVRDLVAKMKLIPIRELIEGKKLLFCEDSIVRGTQLRDTILRLYDHGAREVHMRPACPPLLYACKFLNFSATKSVYELAARKAIKELDGDGAGKVKKYTEYGSDQYLAMEDTIRRNLNLTSLKYQQMDDMVKAIGLPKEKICTYCWDGEE